MRAGPCLSAIAVASWRRRGRRAGTEEGPFHKSPQDPRGLPPVSLCPFSVCPSALCPQRAGHCIGAWESVASAPWAGSDPMGRTCRRSQRWRWDCGERVEARDTVTTPKCPSGVLRELFPLLVERGPLCWVMQGPESWLPHRGSSHETARKGCELAFQGQEQMCQFGRRGRALPQGCRAARVTSWACCWARPGCPTRPSHPAVQSGLPSGTGVY